MRSAVAALTAMLAAPAAASAATDVAVRMAGGSGAGIGVGEQVVYSIDVRNEGSETAQAVTLSDALPAGVEPVSVQTSQGTCSLGSTVECAFGTIDPLGYVTVNIATRTRVEGRWQNTAFVDSDTEDPNQANNSATVVIDIVGPVPPPVSELAVVDPVFRVTRSRRATAFAFVMPVPGRVRIEIQRRTRERRWRTSGDPLSRRAPQGPNVVAFSGRVRRGGRVRRLLPGRYRARVTAIDAGGRASAARAARFRVVR